MTSLLHWRLCRKSSSSMHLWHVVLPGWAVAGVSEVPERHATRRSDKMCCGRVAPLLICLRNGSLRHPQPDHLRGTLPVLSSVAANVPSEPLHRGSSALRDSPSLSGRRVHERPCSFDINATDASADGAMPSPALGLLIESVVHSLWTSNFLRSFSACFIPISNVGRAANDVRACIACMHCLALHGLSLHNPDVVIFTQGPASAVSFLRKLPTIAAKPVERWWWRRLQSHPGRPSSQAGMKSDRPCDASCFRAIFMLSCTAR